MPFTRIKKTCRGAFTLTDTITASLVLIIVIMGTMQYRYHSILNFRKAGIKYRASQVAQTLCESWSGVSGSELFDPVALLSSDIDIADSGQGQSEPDGFTLLGHYQLVVDDFTYDTTLSWEDVNSGLRALNVIVSWPLGYTGEDEIFSVTSYILN